MKDSELYRILNSAARRPIEYFHGDTGGGTGASHQTGWTGLIAKLLQPRP